MISRTTDRFWKLYDELPESIQRSAMKAYRLWRANPFHNSLHFKRLNNHESIYSIRIGKGYRALGAQDGDAVIWFWIGSHEKYEKMISL